MGEDKQYAVVTRVTPVREGGRIIVHTYGPHDLNKAKGIQRRLKAEAIADGYANRVEISVCTLQDIAPGEPME